MTPIHPENLTVLENSLVLTIDEDFSLENDPDVIGQLIGDKRSPNTKREYQKDLKDFLLFVVTASSPPQCDYYSFGSEQWQLPCYPALQQTRPSPNGFKVRR